MWTITVLLCGFVAYNVYRGFLNHSQAMSQARDFDAFLTIFLSQMQGKMAVTGDQGCATCGNRGYVHF